MQNLLDLIQTPQVWGLITGILLPALTSVFQQPQWSKGQRTIIAFVVSAVSGTVAVIASGSFDLTNLLTTVIAVVVASEAAYKKLWQPSGVAAQIEYATSGLEHPEVDFWSDVPDYEDDEPEVEPEPEVEDPELEDEAPENVSPV